jgi:hypothetical protein
MGPALIHGVAVTSLSGVIGGSIVPSAAIGGSIVAWRNSLPFAVADGKGRRQAALVGEALDSSRGKRLAGVGADALHHGPEAVRSLRGEMFP